MALFKKFSHAVFAIGFLFGALSGYARTDGSLQSVLVTDKPVAPALQKSSPVTAPPTPVPSQTVWFGDTPALETELQPQPTPLQSNDRKAVSGGGDIAIPQNPIGPLSTTEQSTELVLNAMGVTTAESAAGPRIRGVVTDGLANQIGIRPGDVITSVHGQEIYSKAELVRTLQEAMRSGEEKVPIVGIRTGRPFMVSANTEQLRQAARDQSNPPMRAQAMQLEPQIVGETGPLVRATPLISPPVATSPVAVAAYSQPADSVRPIAPTLPAQQRVEDLPTPQQATPDLQQAKIQAMSPTAVTSSMEERPQPVAQQQQKTVLRTVRLPNGQLVQVQKAPQVAPNPQPNRQVIRRPLFGPIQQRPLNDRPVGRVLAPVRRFLGR